MPRFSLKTLLMAAAVVPVAAYGLAQATPFLSKIVIMCGAVAWMVAAVLAVEGEGAVRAFSRGFAILSVAWGILTWSTGSIYGNHHLFTYELLSYVHQRIAVTTSFGVGGTQFPTAESFFLIGQVYLCMTFGLLGGWFAAWLYRRRTKANQVSTEASTP